MNSEYILILCAGVLILYVLHCHCKSNQSAPEKFTNSGLNMTSYSPEIVKFQCDKTKKILDDVNGYEAQNCGAPKSADVRDTTNQRDFCRFYDEQAIVYDINSESWCSANNTSIKNAEIVNSNAVAHVSTGVESDIIPTNVDKKINDMIITDNSV
ncbi:MAG: hypothetical protein Faunusvirus15_4 [Faunusvirus sp.]|jgi:hypothetical protein|uniref:Uncharacterized protein n=1 Tax=Faunusvirus sp. TaxID=2487766 RepID=A0A3G5A0T1_9VIRU|nr:MAG: hypothetical protein Faunusvirus15_4 [Faunusvirus sp.]